jgi:AcrR family transcriptional regulator
MASSTVRSTERNPRAGARRRGNAAGDAEPRVGPRRSRKGVESRARLLNAAKTVFERDGFLESRIVDIAETAQLAPGSFYHYFDSKEQIFREVAQAQEERLTAPADAQRVGVAAVLHGSASGGPIVAISSGIATTRR